MILEPITMMGILVVVAPIVAFFTLFLPIYAGMVTSLYLIYQPEDQAKNPVSDMIYDVERVTQSYRALYEHWQHYGADLSFWGYTMPLFAPPVIGVVVGLISIWFFIQYCRNIFRV